MNFENFGLSDELLKAVVEAGYKEATPIQQKAIPTILMGRDIIGLAQTGTGKTASFTLPMIDILSSGEAKSRMPRSLILAPTRELAAQVSENFEKYGKYKSLNKALLVGGESIVEQIKLLEKGVDVLIATPGRLLDLFDRGQILLNGVSILVIDEADKMLDMGFIPDIEKIMSLLAVKHQTLLFSATMPDEIKRLTDKFLTNPKLIEAAPPATVAENLEQFLIWAYPSDKKEIVEALIDEESFVNGYVFCNRKKEVDKISDYLDKKGYKVRGWHGDMDQSYRNESLEKFKGGDVNVLVCSDVAARGIDIQNVSHVINFDVPMNADDYIHRIGRTGRAGAKGCAWTIATKYDINHIKNIEKLISKEIEIAEIEGVKSPNLDGSGNKSSRDDKKGFKPKPVKSNHDASGNNHKKKTNHKENASDVIGFGDDAPAFMG